MIEEGILNASGASREPESEERIEERRKETIREALERTEGEDDSRRAEIIAEAMLAEPGPETTDWLWRILVGGLLFLMFLALAGIIALDAAGKGTQVLMTIFAALLGGLLGLFVPGPGRGG